MLKGNSFFVSFKTETAITFYTTTISGYNVRLIVAPLAASQPRGTIWPRKGAACLLQFISAASVLGLCLCLGKDQVQFQHVRAREIENQHHLHHIPVMKPTPNQDSLYILLIVYVIFNAYCVNKVKYIRHFKG